MKSLLFIFAALFAFTLSSYCIGQIVERERPEAWQELVYGGRFMDRFEPMPLRGELTDETWGADNVLPRDVQNGIEDQKWSYWGGNTKLGSDGHYHLYVCRWAEDSPKGHMQWHDSEFVHAVADHPLGPFKAIERIGSGHNPECYVTKYGTKVVYVINGRYTSESFDGPWEKDKFTFDNRDRKIVEGLSNLTFARREDGSFLMICRGGGVWISEDGLKPYCQISNGSVYPKIAGAFEDPVVWRTNIQYHMIVNDWSGRIAYYLRSKDGVNWKVDSGEAYMPGIAKYEDGTKVDWYKYERIKVFQDEHGRATHANFAVIDCNKWHDLSSDIHSSKLICIPLTIGRLLVVLNEEPITSETELIRVRIQAEEGFDPHIDLDVDSLRFGAPEEVDFGRGCKVVKTKKDGRDLIVVFSGLGNGFTEDNFAGKLLGKTSDGKLLFGYSRLPGVEYLEPLLSTRIPKFSTIKQGGAVVIEVQNFGQVASEESSVSVELAGDLLGLATVPKLAPNEKTTVKFTYDNTLKQGKKYQVRVVVDDGGKPHEVLELKIVPLP